MDSLGTGQFLLHFKNVSPHYVYTYLDKLTNVYGGNSVTYSYTYDGDNLRQTKTTGGEYHDDETGFIYLRNRYYDPKTGRFISEDPAMDGLNWYAYCTDNPVNFVDPWGLEYVVVSGGHYGEGYGFAYNFIEPATLQDLERYR